MHFVNIVAECPLCFGSSSRNKDLGVQTDAEVFSCVTFLQTAIKYLTFDVTDVSGIRLYIKRYTEFKYERAEINVIHKIQIKMCTLKLQISRTKVT
jgi:hypothetical protein